MIKYFCDKCGKEISEESGSNPLNEVNGLEVCHACMWDYTNAKRDAMHQWLLNFKWENIFQKKIKK